MQTSALPARFRSLLWTAAALLCLTTLPAEERRVFVPLDELDSLLEQDARGVLLPRDEFQKLFDQAAANKAAAPPAVGIVLTKAVYTAQVADDQLAVTARITFRQFQPEWQVVQLPFRGMSLEKATIGGQPARLGRDAEQHLVLLNNAAGPQELVLEFTRPLDSAGSDKLAAFELAPIPSAVFQLALPAGKHLEVDGVPLDRPGELDQPATIEFPVGGRKQVALRITDRQAAKATESLIFASTALGVNVAPDETTWQATTNLQVYGQPIAQVELRVPANLQIISIASPGLESWDFTDPPPDETSRGLVLKYRVPFAESRNITIQAVLPPAAGKTKFSIPDLRVANATTHSVRILLAHPAGLRIRVDEVSGVSRIPGEGDAAGLHYAAWREDFQLDVQIEPKAREIRAGLQTDVVVGESGLELTTNVVVESRFAPLFELGLTLPAEWTVYDVAVGGNRVSWQLVPQAAGLHEVRVLLPQPIAAGGEVGLTLKAHHDPETWPVEEEPISVPLPEVRLLQANIVEGTVAITAESHLKLTLPQVSGLDPVRDQNQQNVPASGVTRLTYQYQDASYSGQMQIERLPSRIAAVTLTFSRLDRETFSSHLEALLQITGGGVRTLEASVPESAGTDLRFDLFGTDARIVEQTSRAGDAGRRIWRLQLDQRIRGGVRLITDSQIPRQATAQFTVPVLDVVGVERQSGQISLEASPDQKLETNAVDAGQLPLRELDPAELLAPVNYLPQQRIVAAYEYVLPGYAVTLKETRFDRLGVPTAVGEKLQITSVLGETGELQHTALLTFRAVNVQSLRIALPADATLWSTMIDNQPVEVRKSGTGYLVPLPRTDNPGAARTLQLFYGSQVRALGARGELEQTPPQFTVIDGEGTEQGLEILAQDWRVWHTPETRFVDSDGVFAPLVRLRGTGFLAQLQRAFSVDSPLAVAYKAGGALCAAFIVSVLVLIYRRFGLIKPMVALGGLAVSTMLVLCLIGLITPAMKSVRYAREDVAYKSAATASAPRSEPTMELTREYDSAQNLNFSTAPMEAAPQADFAAPQAAEVQEEALESLSDLKKDISETKPLSRRDGEPAGKPQAPNAEPPKPADEPAPPPAPQAPPPVVNGPGNGQPNDPFAPVKPTPAPLVRPVVTGGLLSLALVLEPPPGSSATDYRYSGGAVGPKLRTVAQNGRLFEYRVLFVAMLTLLAFWICRRSPAAVKGLLLVVGIGLPLGLMSVAPDALLPYLDGVLFGACGGILVWALYYLVNLAHHLHPTNVWRVLKTPLHSTTKTGAGLLLAGLLTAQSASAQDPAPAPPTPPKLDKDTLIVPYDPAVDPLQAERIFLPFDKFVELWNAAHPDQRIAAPAPVESLLAEALYGAQLVPAAENRPATIALTARYVLHTFRDQATVTLPLGKVALDSATLDAQPAPLLVRDDNGQTLTQVVVAGAGLHVVDLKFTLPAALLGPSGKFVLPLQPVPAGALRFTAPAANLTFRVNGVATAFRKLKVDDVDVVVIPIDKGGDVTVAWQPAAEMNAAEGIVHVETTTAVTVAEGGLRLQMAPRYRVRQGTLAEAVFALPAGVRIRQVAGADVGGWELAGEEDARTLKVFLRRKVDDETVLQLDLFLPTAPLETSANLSVPDVAPQGVTRETGTIGVFTAPQLSVRLGKLASLAQIDAAAFAPGPLADPPAGPPALAFTYNARPLQLELVATRRRPRATAVAEHAVRIEPRKVSIASRLQFTLDGAPRSEATVQLPPGYLTLNVRAEGLADWHFSGRADAADMQAAGLLHLEFAQPRTGTFEVLVDGKLPREPEDATAVIAVPSPHNVATLVSQMAVIVDPVYRANFGAPDGWRSVPPGGLNATLLQALGGATFQLAFTSSSTTPPPMEVDLAPAKPRLAADSLTLLAAQDDRLDYSFLFKWNITLAGSRTFVFTAPSWLDGKLEFQNYNDATPIRDVAVTDAGGGRARWRITLEDPVSGGLLLAAQATLPPPADAVVHAPSIVFEEPAGENGAYQPLETQNQFVVLINQSSAQLSGQTLDAVESVAADDLARFLTVDRALLDPAAEIVRIRDRAADVSWKGQKFQTEKSLPASVNLADQTTVVARDGTWRGQVVYRIRNRSRQFLAIRMPPETQILSLFVAGEPARPVRGTSKGQPVDLIPLPKTVEGSLPFDVQLVYAGTLQEGGLARRFRILAQPLQLPTPTVVSQTDDPELGIPVARTTWTVYLPSDYDAHLVKDLRYTNVDEVTETLQNYERQSALLSEVSELVDLNYNSKKATAKANAWNNLKQLGLSLRDYRDEYSSKSGQLNPQEAQRQQELAQQVDKLQRQIQDLEVRNAGDAELQAQLKGLNGFSFESGPPTDGTAQEEVFFEKGQAANTRQLFIANNEAVIVDQSRSMKDQAVKGYDLAQPQSKEADARGVLRYKVNAQAEQLESAKKRHEEQMSVIKRELGQRVIIEPPNGNGRAFTRDNYPKYGTVVGLSNNQAFSGDRDQRSAPNRGTIAWWDNAGAPPGVGGGVGGVVAQQPLPAIVGINGVGEPTQRATPWSTHAGGVSVLFQIPTDGQRLTFSKVGGEPQLAVGVRPHQTLQIALGLAWTALWAGLILGGLALLRRPDAVPQLARRIPSAMLALGLALFLLVPSAHPLCWLGAAAFLAGLTGVGLQSALHRPT